MESLIVTEISSSLLSFSFVVGLFATILVIPPLLRVVGYIGFADKPNPRKIHDTPIPRIGGIGIAIGMFLPILLWVPHQSGFSAYLAGALVVLLGGLWDDYRPLAQVWKVVFQLIAIGIVLWGGIRLQHLSFFGLDPVSDWISYSVTIFFLLGITNATNLFDGLDGLAGGCVLLSLGIIAILSYIAGSNTLTLIAVSAIGATLGFLRYNTHPAIVFMGDAGSQMLGFTVAVLSILLIEEPGIALSFGLPLLILGLPILDTTMVIVLRLKNRRSPFSPDQRHLHHQLLRIGFSHAGSVAILYLIQTVMIIFAYILRFSSDQLVVTCFLVICGLVFGMLYLARMTQFTVSAGASASPVKPEILQWRGRSALILGLRRYLEFAIACLFIFVALAFRKTPHDVGVFLLFLAASLVFAFFFIRNRAEFFSRLGAYTMGLVAAFLIVFMTEGDPVSGLYLKVFLFSLVFCIVLIILFDVDKPFQITPLDVLVFILAIIVPIVARERSLDIPIARHALVAGIILYACECVISGAPQRHRVLKLSSLLSLVLLGGTAVFGHIF